MPSHEIDAQLDRLVDVEMLTYAQAREKLGLVSPDCDPSADSRREAHDYYEQEFGLMPRRDLSPEQTQINRVGLAACQAALDDARQQRSER